MTTNKNNHALPLHLMDRALPCCLILVLQSTFCATHTGNSQYNKLKSRPKLQKTSIKIFAFGSKEGLPVIGKTQVNVSFQGRQVTAEFFVVKGVSESLLSFSTAKELRLIDINVAYNVKTSVSVEDVVDSYSDRFEGLGKLTDTKCKLHVDENVQPVAQPHRRIPFQVRKKGRSRVGTLTEARCH